ncbi:MAG: RDD family protein [Spirochaetales bacterium]|nr:RDD family protein [Spirochaetales bacterium]
MSSRKSDPSEDIKLETPERIRFRYRLAQPGARAAALILDLLIQGGLVILWGLLSLLIGGGSESSDSSGEGGWLVMAFGLLLWFFLQWGYFSFFEIVMNGRTPGKKAMKIMVIREDGKTLDIPSVLLRNFLRSVDSFPVVYAVGALVVLYDGKNRRLGDMVGGTVVVLNEERKFEAPQFTFPAPSLVRDDEGEETIREALKHTQAYLNENQLYLIRRFFLNSPKMGKEQREAQAEKLAELVENNTGVPRNRGKSEDYLFHIYKGHEIHENP